MRKDNAARDAADAADAADATDAANAAAAASCEADGGADKEARRLLEQARACAAALDGLQHAPMADEAGGPGGGGGRRRTVEELAEVRDREDGGEGSSEKE